MDVRKRVIDTTPNPKQEERFGLRGRVAPVTGGGAGIGKGAGLSFAELGACGCLPGGRPGSTVGGLPLWRSPPERLTRRSQTRRLRDRDIFGELHPNFFEHRCDRLLDQQSRARRNGEKAGPRIRAVRDPNQLHLPGRWCDNSDARNSASFATCEVGRRSSSANT